jgi:hypothetical protein
MIMRNQYYGFCFSYLFPKNTYQILFLIQKIIAIYTFLKANFPNNISIFVLLNLKYLS